MSAMSICLLFPAGCLAFHLVNGDGDVPSSMIDLRAEAPSAEACRHVTRGLSEQEQRWLRGHLSRGGL